MADQLADDIDAWRRYALAEARKPSTYVNRELGALALRTADNLDLLERLLAELPRVLAIEGGALVVDGGVTPADVPGLAAVLGKDLARPEGT